MLYLLAVILLALVAYMFLESTYQNDKRYVSLRSFLSGKIYPGSEESVRQQLEAILSTLPKEKRKGFEAYIKSGDWKKFFVVE